MWTHIYDEIEAKGVSRNGNTKPNEKLHGPLKKHYLRRTNFKDVAPQVSASIVSTIYKMTLLQILRAEHICCVARIMREELQHYDELHNVDPDMPHDVEHSESAINHVRLGSAQCKITLPALQALYAQDTGLSKITANNLIKFFRNHLTAADVQRLPRSVQIIDNTVRSDCL